MESIAEKISLIDLPGLVRSAGVELSTSGGRYTGLCPLHSERTPSFQVYQGKTGKWHYHCFGCGEHGDAVDFTQKLHGLDFKGALNYLGIHRGPLTSSDRRKTAAAIRERSRKRALFDFFQEWQRAAIHTYSILLRATHKALGHLTPENFEQYGDILDPLATWTYYLDILTWGPESEKIELLKQHQQNKTILLKRGNLFAPDFDFKRYLKNKDFKNG
jgi:hypothetical protein